MENKENTNNNNNVLWIILVIILIVTSTFIGFKIGTKQNNEEKNVSKENNISDDKLENNDKEENTNKKEENTNNKKENTNKNLIKVEQHLNTNYGDIFVKKDGTVYYLKKDNMKFTKEIGTLDKYSFDYYDDNKALCSKESCPQEAYKLDLTNIVGAYEVYFGNGGESKDIILLDQDGRVNDLSLVKENDNYQMTLKKDVFKKAQIVSVLLQHDSNGSGTILVDTEGNQYDYFGK